MPRGDSGRIVIDIDPQFKNEVYVALASRGSTLKDWFVDQARRLCEEERQPLLLRLAEDGGRYPAEKTKHE